MVPEEFLARTEPVLADSGTDDTALRAERRQSFKLDLDDLTRDQFQELQPGMNVTFDPQKKHVVPQEGALPRWRAPQADGLSKVCTCFGVQR